MQSMLDGDKNQGEKVGKGRGNDIGREGVIIIARRKVSCAVVEGIVKREFRQ